jgi:hypothetical protein
MTSDLREVEKTVDSHNGYITSISNGVIEGVAEGVKEGVASGLRKGVVDGLKECLTEGFLEVGADDITDLLEDIRDKIIKSSIREVTRQVFTEITEPYSQRVCQTLVEKIKERDIRIPVDQTTYALGYMKKNEEKAWKRIARRLPENYILRAVMDAVHAGLIKGLEENFRSCEERLRKEMEKQS